MKEYIYYFMYSEVITSDCGFIECNVNVSKVFLVKLLCSLIKIDQTMSKKCFSYKTALLCFYECIAIIICK